MENPRTYSIVPVGVVRSPITRRGDAPMQPDADTPNAWVEIDPSYAPALHGIAVGDRLVLITWLHEAARDVLQVHPRGDRDRPKRGVFRTRSPARPNPLGLHAVQVLRIEDNRVEVGPLEAIDGTPVIDIKRALSPT